MFANRQATVMVPAKNVDRARAWYDEKLGLKSQKVDENGADYKLGGNVPMFLYKSDYAGTAEHTLISFASPDLSGDMKALRAKGVKFIDYDLPGVKTHDGVAEFETVKVAWTKDSEGNILSLMQGR